MKMRSMMALIAASFPLAAFAIPVTYQFSGTLNQRGSTLPEWYEFEFPHVTEFSGSFTLDTDVVPLYADANQAYYYDVIRDLRVSFGPDGSLGTYVQSYRPMSGEFPNTSSVFLLNDFPASDDSFTFDQFGLAMMLEPVTGDSPYLTRSFSLGAWAPMGTLGDWSPNTSLFSSVPTLDQLPEMSSDADEFWQASVGIQLYDSNGGYVAQASYGGDLSDLSRVDVSVPLPGTFGLLMAGLAGIGIVRRRHLG